MYYDVPGWMSTFNLLKCLYKNHPVRIDIAGTVESISHITDKLLYDCYDTFYNLNNMALAVVGNVDVESVLSVCDEVLKNPPMLKSSAHLSRSRVKSLSLTMNITFPWACLFFFRLQRSLQNPASHR